jgi:hypothetical protein
VSGEHGAEDAGQVGVVLDHRGPPSRFAPPPPSSSTTVSLERGSVNQNVEPWPGSLSTQILPRAVRRSSGRWAAPSPKPPFSRESDAYCPKRSKIASRWSAALHGHGRPR